MNNSNYGAIGRKSVFMYVCAGSSILRWGALKMVVHARFKKKRTPERNDSVIYSRLRVYYQRTNNLFFSRLAIICLFWLSQTGTRQVPVGI